MIFEESYRKSFFIALGLHLSLAIFLLIDTSSNQRPSMTVEARNNQEQSMAAVQKNKEEEQTVKAVTVDSSEVMDAVNRLKQERMQQARAEQSRQQQLDKQAEMARQERLKEQRQLAKLKDESEKLAIARKKQIEEEKKRLRELAEQKIVEAKRLEELKNKQQVLQKKQKEEADKLAKLQQEKLKQEHLKNEQAKEASARADKAKAELAEKNRQAAAQQAAADAAKHAQMAGVIDKYKAMIINSISRQWIIPENTDRSMSSQFRIRLAPTGDVLEVNLTRSSGDPLLDRSAQTAIYKASPLPVPNDPETFNTFRDITLTVRPENLRG